MSEVIDFCQRYCADPELRSWAEQYQTMADVWASCNNTTWMLWMLDKSGWRTDQDDRLYAVWCARRVATLSGDCLFYLLDVAELYAKGKAGDGELRSACDTAKAVRTAIKRSRKNYLVTIRPLCIVTVIIGATSPADVDVAKYTAQSACRAVASITSGKIHPSQWDAAEAAESAAQCNRLRELANPFVGCMEVRE